MNVRLIVKKGASKPQSFNLHSAEIIIGRQQGCHVRIPDASVSRQHCMLSWGKKGLYVEDLQSANGTYLNDELVTKRAKLLPGDHLQIGPLVFKIQFDPSDRPQENEAVAPGQPQPADSQPRQPQLKRGAVPVVIEPDVEEDDETISVTPSEPDEEMTPPRKAKKTKKHTDEVAEDAVNDVEDIMEGRNREATSEADMRNIFSELEDDS